MAWEQRRSGRYFYRKRKVVSEYGGSGFLGDLASSVEEQKRHQRSLQRLQDARFKQEQQRIDKMVDDYSNQVRQVVSTVLQALGYHRHRRQWRLKRMGENHAMANEIAQANQQMFDEYNHLLAAASVKKPHAADLERLRQYGIDHPAIFEQSSMLGQGTIHDVIDSCSTNEATKIHMKGEARELARSLGYTKATALERLLIQNIVLCWIRLIMMEQTYTNYCMSGNGITMATGEYLERRLSATQRRYLLAVESLARVRGLLARAGVQINVAQNQVVQNG